MAVSLQRSTSPELGRVRDPPYIGDALTVLAAISFIHGCELPAPVTKGTRHEVSTKAAIKEKSHSTEARISHGITLPDGSAPRHHPPVFCNPRLLGLATRQP
jgi:hypothetical protein